MLPHALYLAQLLHRRIQHSGQRAKLLNEVMGQAVYIPLGDGVKEQQLQHSVVGPALDAPGQKFRFHPLAVTGMTGHWESLLSL